MRTLWLLALTPTIASCSSTISLARYAEIDPGPSWAAFAEGQKVAVDARGEACKSTRTGASAELAEGRGEPISGQKWAQSGDLWTIKTALVAREEQRVLLELAGEEGNGAHWVSLPSSGESCVHAVDAASIAALKGRVGKQLVFAPWRAECTELEAAGQSPGSLLFESDPGSPLPITNATVAPASASGGGAPVPWLVFAKGALRVRADQVDQCFVAPDAEDATVPADVRTLLRTSSSQCPGQSFQGKTHVACSSSVGTWEGLVTDSAVSVRLVRRTFGPIHFLGGKPVQRDAFARAIVAIRTGAATSPREEALYRALQGTVRSALAGEGGLVRTTAPGDPSATMELYVGASKLTIAELSKREESGKTTYPDHQETQPNPRKAEARRDVASAEQQISRAEAEVTQAEQKVVEAREQKARNEELKKEAIRECHARADALSGLARSLAQGACTGADIGINPDGGLPEAQQAVAQAKGRLAEARSKKANADAKVASTPETVTEWVMMPWTFQRRVYSRAVSVELNVKVTPKDGQPTERAQPVSLVLEDFEVDADPTHKVDGHAANTDIVKTPENLIPQIAVKLSERLAGELHQILTQEQQASALRLFAESGGEPAREEYRTLDAVAFEAVGKRLSKAARRGMGRATPAGLPLPVTAVTVGAGQCLLAVVLAENPADAALTLSTPSGAFADLRKKNVALVEMCGAAAGDEAVTVSAEAPVGVRWGLYLLGGKATKKAEE